MNSSWFSTNLVGIRLPLSEVIHPLLWRRRAADRAVKEFATSRTDMAPPSMPPPSPAYLAGQRAKLVSAPQAKEDGCGRCASLLAWGDAKVPPTWCGSLSRPLEAVAASSSALHHYQACVGSGLYFFLSLVRLVPVAGSLLFLLLPVPVFMPLYRRLSHNRAGGYYDTLVQQLTRLPQHQADIKRRGCCQMSDEYRIGLERERRDGIVRACNALESALVCYMIAVPFLNLFPANPLEVPRTFCRPLLPAQPNSTFLSLSLSLSLSPSPASRSPPCLHRVSDPRRSPTTVSTVGSAPTRLTAVTAAYSSQRPCGGSRAASGAEKRQRDGSSRWRCIRRRQSDFTALTLLHPRAYRTGLLRVRHASLGSQSFVPC